VTGFPEFPNMAIPWLKRAGCLCKKEKSAKQASSSRDDSNLTGRMNKDFLDSILDG
jgi:hypothetical protein